MDLDRWQQLMNTFQFQTNEDTYQLLNKCYSERHRRYHNRSHIEAVLHHLDTVTDLAEHPSEIELALWFHDVIYKPFSTSNELDSAVLATQFLTKNSAGEDVISRVHKLIMATLHTARADTVDESLLVDIDLTILGASDYIFIQFEKDIRKEYKWIPFFIYKKKRKEVLSSFLDRDRIYQTNFFFKKFEVKARSNLNSAIQSL